jgi:hypothetical protein
MMSKKKAKAEVKLKKNANATQRVISLWLTNANARGDQICESREFPFKVATRLLRSYLEAT